MKRTFKGVIRSSPAEEAFRRRISRGTSEKNKDEVAVSCRDVAVQTYSNYGTYRSYFFGGEMTGDTDGRTHAVVDEPTALEPLKHSLFYMSPHISRRSPGLYINNFKRAKKKGEKTPATKSKVKSGLVSYAPPSGPNDFAFLHQPQSATEQSSPGCLGNPCSLNLPSSTRSTSLSPPDADPPHPGSSHAIWQPCSGLVPTPELKFRGWHPCKLQQHDIFSAEPKLARAINLFSSEPLRIPYKHSRLQATIDSYLNKNISYIHKYSMFSKPPSTKNKFTQNDSLPDALYKDFTPDITPDFDDETYRFQCSSPGLYLCSVTGLMFDMKGEGDVVYRIVPWNRRLLDQHHKKPAGPLFDIKCVQQCVRQLHLPHCEVSSSDGSKFLSVAHVTDDDNVEFIKLQRITETHAVIDITGFSGYGNVKDKDSPPDLVRALVLLFYSPCSTHNRRSVLNMLLVPRNVVIRDVQRTRRKLIGDEKYIETSPHCKLRSNQVYTLSTSPQNAPIKVQPREAEFDGESHTNYFNSFHVILRTAMTDIELFLKDTSGSLTVWESEVCLPSSSESDSGQRALSEFLFLNDKLLSVRTSFIDAISEPVLKSLVDKLLEKKVITDCERESVNVEQTRADKARVVIDTVRKKGEEACLQMIQSFYEADSFLCKHLGLR